MPSREDNQEKAKEPLEDNVEMNVDDIPGKSIPERNVSQSEQINIQDPSQSQTQTDKNAGSPLVEKVSMTVEDEMELPNPRECLRVFLVGNGTQGPPFDANIH